MSKSEGCLGEASIENTGFAYTLKILSGKYKILILYWLHYNQPNMRFNQLKRCINHISYKTLSNTLKEMEQNGIIYRKEYPQIPPKVEYGLTETGKTLMPLLNMMCEWGEVHKNNNDKA